MRPELVIKSRSLAGSSDLTILAPIKPGLIPSLDSVTFKTRLKRLLSTLNAGRASSHEYSLLRPFSDAVERVGRILSVRVAIIEPDKVLLSVTFDGGLDSYLRVLWQKVGTLLDVIFCNSEGYKTAWDNPYEVWADWVRSVQIETDFFYGMPGLSVDDVRALRREEFLYLQVPGGYPADLHATRQVVQTVEEATWSRLFPPAPHITKDAGRQGLRALALVYRLASYYLPGTADGDILHRAARDLLQEFIRLDKWHELDQVLKEGRKRFAEQIDWLLKTVEPRKMPELPGKKPEPDKPGDVQGGILAAYPPSFTHGCLLMVAFPDRAEAGRFIHAMADRMFVEGSEPEGYAVTIGLTCEGLRALGVAEADIDQFPPEFREGMEARASLLGDLRTNHPRRWNLPRRNCGGADGADPTGIVELSSVHAVVQIRTEKGKASYGEQLDADDPVHTLVEALRLEHSEVEFLSVQPLVRNVIAGMPREHFGFADGLAQPVLDPKENGKVYDRNQIHLGELLLGYPNEGGNPHEVPELLHNGSFLVVRKLRQDVEALEDAVKQQSTGLTREVVLAKMMGRTLDGDPLAKAGSGNDFDYSAEPAPGSLCPIHSHIRRANPRRSENPDLEIPPGRRTPRLMRRGLSYGPPYDPKDPASGRIPRGTVFMAYNASIAEQFEVVQRWISGGNSSGGFSGQSDPFLGVAPNGERRYFRFEDKDPKGQPLVCRVALDGSESVLGDPRPFVRLEWGMYLFAPSIRALRRLAETAGRAAGKPDEVVWSEENGLRQIADLIALGDGPEAAQAWKQALEDPEAQKHFAAAGIWAAIRKHYHGVLRTPYGVIVADAALIKKVLDERGTLFSVKGYHERMVSSIGEIFLGLDDEGSGCPYREQSKDVNIEIGRIGKEETFSYVRQAAGDAVRALVENEKKLAEQFSETRWELSLDIKEVVDSAMAALCRHWFGLPEQKCEIQPGGARWDWKIGEPPLYPGHFTAPSRFFFQPLPGEKVEKFGVEYGQALRNAFHDLIARHRNDPAQEPVLDATRRLTKVILDAFPRRERNDPERDDLAARTMVGVLMGFLPTLDGSIRLSLNEWLRDGTFWRLRSRLKERDPALPFANAEDLLEPELRKAMQLRPMPELIWRVATDDTEIGGEAIRPGDHIVLGLVSATHEALESGATGVCPIFGGDRSVDPHPTHACPGYEAAMGALLGIASALLEIGEPMRPSLAPLALTFEGDLPPPPAKPGEGEQRETLVPAEVKETVPQSVLSPAGRVVTRAPTTVPRPTPSVKTRLRGDPREWRTEGGKWEVNNAAELLEMGEGPVFVADGDSWFSYRKYGIGSYMNIAAYLADQKHFNIDNLASTGTRLYDFYDDDRNAQPLKCDKPQADSRRMTRLVNRLKWMANQGAQPAAILFSAAGNDVVEDRLAPLINKAPAQDMLNGRAVDDMVDGLLKCWLTKVLQRIMSESDKAFGQAVPIFIHGYDFPVPDCRFVKGVSEWFAWLYPYIKAKGWENQTFPAYPANGVKIMHTLIQRLNDMQKLLVGAAPFKNRVFHIDLTGQLSSAQGAYTKDWDNELHPNEVGCTKLTDVFAAEIAKHVPSLAAAQAGGGR